jgi:hypothetical protein
VCRMRVAKLAACIAPYSPAGALCGSHKTCRLRERLGAVEGKMLAEIEKISLKSLMA